MIRRLFSLIVSVAIRLVGLPARIRTVLRAARRIRRPTAETRVPAFRSHSSNANKASIASVPSGVEVRTSLTVWGDRIFMLSGPGPPLATAVTAA